MNTPGVSWTVSFCQDFIVQLCRGSSEGDISVLVAGGPLAVSIGMWQWKEKAGIFQRSWVHSSFPHHFMLLFVRFIAQP